MSGPKLALLSARATMSVRSLLDAGLVRVAGLAVLLLVFLTGIHGFGVGLALLGKGVLDSFFRATQNPFSALVVGILATSIVQSSSVTTSLIVGLTAAPENPLPLANAVPMVMGANFGTTVTNSIAAMAHWSCRNEFRRAFAVGTCDDFFEIFSVCIILPIEISTGLLGRAAVAAADALTAVGGVEYTIRPTPILEVGTATLESILRSLFEADAAVGTGVAVISVTLILASLVQIVKRMRSWTGPRARHVIALVVEQSPIRGLIVGCVVTAIIQSSSVTTSLLVPLVGAGLVGLEGAFPVILGANLGTTLTAFMAALAVSGPNANAGLAIAIVHLLYNLAGVAIFLPFQSTRRLPLMCAQWLAGRVAASRWKGFLYILAIFYGVPALFALIYELSGN